MLFFKILQEFLLPSVFTFILILLGSFFLIWFRKQRVGQIFLISGLFLYYFFSITPVSDLILWPLEKQYQKIWPEQIQKTNKAVLLLGGREETILRASETLMIYAQNSSRILREKTQEPEPGSQNLKIIISGSNPIRPSSKEGEDAKEFLIDRGVERDTIILEDKSRNTFESAKAIKGILGQDPFFLVTSAYHMPRSVAIFKKLGSNPIPVPTDFRIKKNYTIFDFFPNSANIHNADLAFHEYFGILFYNLAH